MNPEQVALLAYLDQEEAKFESRWNQTDNVAKMEFGNWLAAGMPMDDDIPEEWMDFASTLALCFLQRWMLSKM